MADLPEKPIRLVQLHSKSHEGITPVRLGELDEDLEETLESTHQLFGKKMCKAVLSVYTKQYARGKEVIERLDNLRKRGRYKENY